jgi:hypothetical protein
MLKKILIGVGALVILFLGVVAMQPATYSVTRSAEVSGPPELAFGQVNDFHHWVAWSPWEKLDPAMKKTFTGAEAGTGAVYAWEGNDDVGAGRMTIQASKPGEAVEIKLEFLKPFPSTSITTFTFEPAGAGTKVTWTMKGDNNFMSKAFGLFKSMDSMIGGDFEKGLAQLKVAVEREAAQQAAAKAEAAPPQADLDAGTP